MTKLLSKMQLFGVRPRSGVHIYTLPSSEELELISSVVFENYACPMVIKFSKPLARFWSSFWLRNSKNSGWWFWNWLTEIIHTTSVLVLSSWSQIEAAKVLLVGDMRGTLGYRLNQRLTGENRRIRIHDRSPVKPCLKRLGMLWLLNRSFVLITTSCEESSIMWRILFIRKWISTISVRQFWNHQP